MKRELIIIILVILSLNYTLAVPITPERVGTHNVAELSGIVASKQYSGIYWAEGDSGQPATIYAIREDGTRVNSFPISGATNRDWEDIAIDENNNIWIGEIGDNSQVHPEYILYKVAEPNPSGPSTSIPSTAYRFIYPDGKKDAEALFIWQGIPHIVQKRPTNAKVYRFPGTPDSSILTTLIPIGEFNNANNWITGADISQDGKRLALINDNPDYHWIVARSSANADISDFFTNPLWQWRVDFSNGQGEAITFKTTAGNEYDVLVVSEFGEVWRITQSLYESTNPMPVPKITLTLNSPPDNTVLSSQNVEFSCTAATPDQSSSLTSIELNVKENSPITLVGISDTWKYDDTNTNFPDTWTSLTFDDSAWKEGPGPLGYGDATELAVLGTVMTMQTPRQPTYYLRKKFTINNLAQIKSLKFDIDFDDSFIMYINGQEITRQNVANSDHNTFASSVHNWNGDSGSPSPWYNYQFTQADLSLLREGENIIAIEVHQQSATSSDVMMRTTLTTTPSTITQTAPANGQSYTATFNVQLAQNQYTWNCIAYDNLGNTGTAPADYNLEITLPSPCTSAIIKQDCICQGKTRTASTGYCIQDIFIEGGCYTTSQGDNVCPAQLTEKVLETKQSYYYLQKELSSASGSIQLLLRQSLLFSNYLVLFDELSIQDTSLTKNLEFKFEADPTINSNSFSILNIFNSKNLFATVLLPIGIIINKLNPSQNQWTIQESLQNTIQKNNFLNIYQISDTAQPPALTQLSQQNGAFIRDSSNAYLALFSPQDKSKVTYTFDTEGKTINHIITGLKPNTQYDILCENNLINSYTSSPAGIIEFSAFC